MTKPDQEEKIRKLIDKAVNHINKAEIEEARVIVDKIMKLDPESLDGHILTAQFYKFLSPERFQHLKFVMDKDCTHIEPFELNNRSRGFIDEFLDILRMEYYDKETKRARNEINEEIIYYSSKVLEAGIDLPSVHDFVEALIENSHFEEVINVGFVLIKDKTGKEVGWPGLSRYYKYKEIESTYPLVMAAFFESKRYTEGCRWIYKCFLGHQDDHFLWFLLGEALAWMGYPEETARAWIISIEKGNYNIAEREMFETLAYKICDPLYEEKSSLFYRLYDLKNQIPPELKSAFDEIYNTASSAMDNPDKPVPSKDYIEKKLGMELKERKDRNMYSIYKDSRLHIPSDKSKDPIIQEIIKTIDAYIEADVDKTTAKLAEEEVKKAEKREKVGVGASTSSVQNAITLSQFGINITEQAAGGEIPPIIGRDREIDRMVRILARSEKNNPVLLGEAGVGKTAVVYGLAQRIVSANVPENLRNKTIIELNVGALVAGTTFRGDFEQRMNNIIKEMREDPNKILFIDEFHTLIGAGDSKGKLDASNILKPALSAGEIRLIGATTSREYSRSIEHDAAFERRFSPVWLNEISQEVTFLVLKARVPHWHKHHGVEISDEILYEAIHLTDQHIRHRHFPDKAIDLIDEACALARINSIVKKKSQVILKAEHVKTICDQWTGASDNRIVPKSGYVNDIELQLNGLITGHRAVLQQLSIIITDEKLGLVTSRLPRVLYFYGFPDTGKTECAKALSKILWPGEKERFLYIDMELLHDTSDLNRLMGAPRGSIGSEEGGRLSIHLSQNPYTVVYLYNFHKSHERIIRFFTGLFREGSFSDGSGRNIFAGNAIFILSATVDNTQSVGFKLRQEDNNHGKNNVNDQVPDMLRRLNISKEVFQFIKNYYFFDQLNEPELRVLLAHKINTIKNQPGIRDLDIRIDESIIDKMVRDYQKSPVSSRSLHGLVQKFVYPAIID